MVVENKTSINEQSDIELYKSFLNGNKEAFNQLILRHRKQLTLFIMKYVKKLEVAEDIVQDSFVYMLINKVDYDFKYSFRTYIYTIAKSRTLNYLKNKSKIVSMEDVLTAKYYDEEMNIEEIYIKKEEREKIQKAIKKLKKDYQIVIYLYDFQGFKYREISEILNQSMSKTKMMIHRAKKQLKNILKEENEIC